MKANNQDWTPIQGELVLVRDEDDCSWVSRKYIATNKLGSFPYVVADEEDEEAPIAYRQMKRIEKTFTIELTEVDAGFITASMRGHLHNKDWTPVEFHCMKVIHDSIINKILTPS